MGERKERWGYRWVAVVLVVVDAIGLGERTHSRTRFTASRSRNCFTRLTYSYAFVKSLQAWVVVDGQGGGGVELG